MKRRILKRSNQSKDRMKFDARCVNSDFRKCRSLAGFAFSSKLSPINRSDASHVAAVESGKRGLFSDRAVRIQTHMFLGTPLMN